jgi:CHASE1-domain containing sensor protein
MPGFEEELSSEQIANIANYVRVKFGSLPSSDLTAADVDRVITAEPEQPFLIKYAGWLAALGIIVAIVIIFFIIRAIIRSRRNH